MPRRRRHRATRARNVSIDRACNDYRVGQTVGHREVRSEGDNQLQYPLPAPERSKAASPLSAHFPTIAAAGQGRMDLPADYDHRQVIEQGRARGRSPGRRRR